MFKLIKHNYFLKGKRMKKKEKVLTEHQAELEKEVNKQMKELYHNDSKKVKSTANIRKLIPYYTRYRALFIGFIVVLIAYMSVSFIEPVIGAEILEYLTNKDFKNVMKFATIFLIGGFVLAIIRYFLMRLRSKLNFKIKFDLRQKMIDSIDRISMNKIDEINSSVLISRIQTDCANCSSTIILIIDSFLNMIKSLMFFLYVAFINIWLFLVLAIYVFVKYLLDSYRFGIWRKSSKINRRRYDNAHGIYFEQIRGIRDVKSLNLRDNMANVSAEKVRYVYDLDMQIEQRMHKWYHFTSFPLDYLVEFILIALGIVLIRADIIGFAGFMVVFMYKDRALALSSHVTNLKDKLTEGELSAERYFDVVERFDKETFGEVEKTIEVGEIKLRDVYFDYDENSQVLKGVNLNIEPNKTTAIVGPSGSGKSTLLSIIGKMYNPDKGIVYIDDTNLQDLTETSLRNAIGIVNQNPYIFNASIKNNMKYVKPDATDEEIWNALDRAQIGGFVRGLDGGLDSMIGENGVKVSGGQKQRLAIARVLLKGNKVLVFDEATSSLDNNSQSEIVKELDKLKVDHTVIVVAHRLSTIVDADKIVVIDDGKVVAEGKHRSLLKSCAQYKQLYLDEEKNSQLADNSVSDVNID